MMLARVFFLGARLTYLVLGAWLGSGGALMSMRRGLAADVDAAEAMMKARRPRIWLGAAQRALVISGEES